MWPFEKKQVLPEPGAVPSPPPPREETDEEREASDRQRRREAVLQRLIRLLEKIDYENDEEPYGQLNGDDALRQAGEIVAAANHIVMAGDHLCVWPHGTDKQLGEVTQKALVAHLYAGLRTDANRVLCRFLTGIGVPQDFVDEALDAVEGYGPDDSAFDDYDEPDEEDSDD